MTGENGDQGSITFTRLPISLPCRMPVVPGTPDTLRDGDPIPLKERTEACAVDAFWMIGAIPTCDVHARQVCDVLDLDYEEIREESGGAMTGEDKPWGERNRYSQRMAKGGPPWKGDVAEGAS